MTSSSVVLLTFSLCGLIVAASLVVIASLFYEAQSLLTESLTEMSDFKNVANDAWTKMAYGSNGARLFRFKKSLDICSCSLISESSCPQGSPGPKGVRGSPGNPGLPGTRGRKGASGLGLQNRPGGCLSCPAGAVGEPGPDGHEGAPGRDGDEGLPGGIQGPAGPPGDQGSTGVRGPRGKKGVRGLDGGQCVKPNPGPPGLRGPPGPRGPEGSPGDKGKTGNDGREGYPGLPGQDGMIGEDGAPGPYGDAGLSGEDATYCRCPHRSPGVVKEVFPSYKNSEDARKKRFEMIRIPKAQIIYF